jgi:hypothetical protein
MSGLTSIHFSSANLNHLNQIIFSLSAQIFSKDFKFGSFSQIYLTKNK